MIYKFLVSLWLLTALPFVTHSNEVPKHPTIKSIDTVYPKDGIWIVIPKGTKKITFYVKATNTDTILFWLIPTGTGTWKERRLIGYDIKEDENDTDFSLTWDIEHPFLHNHLHVQALGEGISNDIINLYMD